MPSPHVSHFPEKIRTLEPYEGSFDAYRLNAEGCDVLFAAYPAGSEIPAHAHASENHGVVTMGELILLVDGRESRLRPGEWYRLAANQRHAARFESDTAIIEFWFRT